MTYAKRIFKNTSVLLSSQIISYILAFFYIIYIARYLGVEDFGLLSFALAFTGIFGILADLGLNNLTVREIARNKSVGQKYIGNIIIIKLILGLITFGFISLIIFLLNYPQKVTYVIYIVALSVILSSMYGTLNSFFQAYEKMEYQSFGQILNSILMFLGVILAIFYEFTVVGFAFIYLIASAIILLYSIIILVYKFFLPKIEINWKFWKITVKEALPFGLSGVFSTIYVWIDSVMLFFMQGNEAVGLYNAAYRLIIVLLFIQSASSISMFPVMSKLFVSSHNSLKKTVEKYFKFMLIISIPIGIGVMILADKIILLIFGLQYEKSIIALQILIWATVFTFIYTAFVQLFLSTNKQVTITKITGFCMVTNIILNLVLIPKFGYIGASIVTVITEFLILVFVFKIAQDIGYGISKKQLKLIIKVIIASLLMGFFIIYFKYLNIFLLILFVIIIYITLIISIKCIDREDIILVKKIIRKDSLKNME